MDRPLKPNIFILSTTSISCVLRYRHILCQSWQLVLSNSIFRLTPALPKFDSGEVSSTSPIDSPIVPSNLPSVRSWFKVEIQEADSNSFVCRSLENVATGGVKRVIVRVSRAAEVAACPGTSTRVEMFARLSCRKNQRNRLEHDKGEPSFSSAIAILYKYAHLHDNSQASVQTQTPVS